MNKLFHLLISSKDTATLDCYESALRYKAHTACFGCCFFHYGPEFDDQPKRPDSKLVMFVDTLVIRNACEQCRTRWKSHGYKYYIIS